MKRFSTQVCEYKGSIGLRNIERTSFGGLGRGGVFIEPVVLLSIASINFLSG